MKKIYEFLKFINQFKTLKRYIGATYWKEYPLENRFESDADHTWRMAMMFALINDELETAVDFEKTMKMILIHDIPEIIAGDHNPMGESGTGEDGHAYNEYMADNKFQREKRAAEDIFSKLPERIGDELLDLWLEFEHQSSQESQVAKAIDTLEGRLHSYQMRHEHVYENHHEFNMEYGIDRFKADPALKELGDLLLEEMEENFTVYEPDQNT
jgi:putative hydrolase of HD superfamily